MERPGGTRARRSAVPDARIPHDSFDRRILGQLFDVRPGAPASGSEALTHWPRYAVAFTLMGVAAAGTALSAYLLGKMTNEAYVDRNFHGIVVVAVVAMAIFAIKGMASYGATVMLSAIGNRIVADNQRRMFDKLLQQNIGFFADRHSSEFIARLTTGANAVSR
jgi:ATP-binding cassette, subfamily B, bacterial MsbA